MPLSQFSAKGPLAIPEKVLLFFQKERYNDLTKNLQNI